MSQPDVLALLDAAARQHEVDIAPEKLLAIVVTAFAPHEAMTESERRFLLESGAPQDSFDPYRQALARARLTARAAATLAESSPLLSTNETAEMLSLIPRTVRHYARNNDLYAVVVQPPGRRRLLGFPTWQFHDHQRLPHLRHVLKALPQNIHPLSVDGFMATAQEELDDQTPRDWLIAGGPAEPVLALIDSLARS